MVDTPPVRPQIWVPGSSRTEATHLHRFWCRRVDPSRDVTVVNNIPTLNPAATLCLLGRVASTPMIERCLDGFLRSYSMTWLAETFDRLHASNCRGTSRLGETLGDPKRTLSVTDSWF